MNFQNAILTNVGRNLLATVHAGNKLIWTKAIISTSPVTAGAIPGMTTQAGDHWITENINIMTQGSTCHISVVFTNQGLETNFSARLCGIYAKTQVSGDDVLIAVARPNITSFAVPMESYGVMQYVIDFSMTIDNSENIELQLLTSGYASSTALQTTNQAVWQNRQDIDAIRNWKLFRTYPSVLHALAYAEEGETCSISTQTIQRFNIPQLGHPDLEGFAWNAFNVHEIVDGLVLGIVFDAEQKAKALVFRLQDMLEGKNTLLYVSPDVVDASPGGLCKLRDRYFIWTKTEEDYSLIPVDGVPFRYAFDFGIPPSDFNLYSHNGRLFQRSDGTDGMSELGVVVDYRDFSGIRRTIPVYSVQGQSADYYEQTSQDELMVHCRLFTGEEAYIIYSNESSNFYSIYYQKEGRLEGFRGETYGEQQIFTPHADGVLAWLRDLSTNEEVVRTYEAAIDIDYFGDFLFERRPQGEKTAILGLGSSLYITDSSEYNSNVFVAKSFRGGAEIPVRETDDFEDITSEQEFVNFHLEMFRTKPLTSGCSYLPMGKDGMLCDRAFNMPFRQLLKRDGKLLPVLS